MNKAKIMELTIKKRCAAAEAVRRNEMSVIRAELCDAMQVHYEAARRQLADAGVFGKALDNKARKLALKMSGKELPIGMNIAFATPDGWGSNGYRSA